MATTGTPLDDYLKAWAHTDSRRNAVALTISNIAVAGQKIARLVQLGPLSGELAAKRGSDHGGGDVQKELDVVTNEIMRAALLESPVAWMGSEEETDALALTADAPLVVNTDPLDGSSNIDTNVSIGTIFSILPATGPLPLLQRGRNQIAAGYIIYGPQTALVLTVGDGTDIFWLDPDRNLFVLMRSKVTIGDATREYAINASNARHWGAAITAYIADCELGADGPRGADFNMRWIGSLVADTFRILTRGGIFLYPGDGRKGYADGRLRLLYEANPIAMLVEQAGGAATTGTIPVLDIEATSLHQRAPLIFGSKAEVDHVLGYFSESGA